MQTIITAAGATPPELLAGAERRTKFLIEIEGQTVIERSIRAYSVENSALNVVIRDTDASTSNLRERILAMYPQAKVTAARHLTQGALISSLLAAADLDAGDPLVIAAGDSEISVDVTPIVASFIRDGLDAGTIVFSGNGDRWSYVSTNAQNEVVEVSEKYQLGNLATTGFFFFRSVRHFLDAAKWVLVNNATFGGNFYVSSAVNHLISSGLNVGFKEISATAYQPWSRKSDFDDANVKL